MRESNNRGFISQNIFNRNERLWREDFSPLLLQAEKIGINSWQYPFIFKEDSFYDNYEELMRLKKDIKTRLTVLSQKGGENDDRRT